MSGDTVEAGTARLGWVGAEGLPPEVRDSLIGPGAPFEMVDKAVGGRPVTVFARRPANLRALLDEAVGNHPDRPFLVGADRTWTYAEARDAVDAVAAVLAGRHGIGPGDRVAIVSANSPEYGLTMWATLSLGAIVVSLNGWWTGPELQYGISLTSPALITGDERRLARLAEVGPPAGAEGVPVVTLAEIVASAATPGPAPTHAVDEEDPAVILFTSGTTGRPKGATLSHRNIANFACVNRLNVAVGGALMAQAGMEPPAPFQPASVLSSPMFHVSGMLAILVNGPGMGGKLVFAPPGRWDAGRHLDMTEEHGITTWSGVPTQFWRMLRHPDFRPERARTVRSVGSGGAVFPPELIRELTEQVPWVSLGNGYGMSETVGLGTLVNGQKMVAAPDSVGPAQPGSEIEIRDPVGGRLLAEGETGEIHVRNASVFLGYWSDPDATAAVMDDDGWYRTGDFGRVEDGKLYLESRMRDLILRGGENIYPIEIENRLVEHPDIDDAAVIGVDHVELGQEVKAFVVPRAGARLTAADVQRWAGEALARFKVPAHVEMRDSLPYTDTGKVLKHELEREESSPKLRS
jgi:acyl-CoA synthetase (AMP-forming)/AMP-acid ligase II